MFPEYAGDPELVPLLVIQDVSDPYTMYMHQEMCQHDESEFCKSMQK